ncbi:hypothetical protein [Actinosynnema sp. NPDC023587]|uniref:hypothetical protein n=1 Tax=Actinosynnema sp. NPDC023587 TaxID=3154695 RepID=UPI0033E3A6F0
MSEAELRKSLRAAVGDEPPLDFDADALIERAQGVRAARRRRRALVAVGAATVVLMGTVLSLPGVLSARDVVQVDALTGRVLTTAPVGAVPSGTSPSSFAKPTSSVPASVAPPGVTTSADPASRRLTALSGYLADRFAAVVPGVWDVRVEFADDRAKPAAGLASGFVHFEDDEGSGGVVVRLTGPPTAFTRDDFCAGVRCEHQQKRADGSVVEFATSSSGSSPDVVSHSVAHFRADGTVVQVTGYNYDPAQGGKTRDVVPVTLDQLLILATDPRLDLR